MEPMRCCHASLNFVLRAMRAVGAGAPEKKGSKKGEEDDDALAPVSLWLLILSLSLGVLYAHAVWTGHGSPSLPSAVALRGSNILPANADHSLVFPDPAKQHHFRRQGPHLFVQYSAYRLSARSFVALGLLSRDLVHLATNQLQKCSWHPFATEEDEGKEVPAEPIGGSVRLIQNSEHHDMAYRLLFIFCTLDRDVPSPASGGLGGRLFLDLEEGVESLLYREDPGFEPFTAYENDQGPFLHNVSQCSAPMYGQLHPERVAQWTKYHFLMGIDHFLFLDAGAVDSVMRTALKPFTDSGVVQIEDFRRIQDYPTYLAGQLLAVNDCVYRFRQLTKWLLYADFDEFLWVDKPYASLHDLLSKHVGKPYLTHGVMWYDTKQCLPLANGPEARWPIERMLWHWPTFWCMHKEKFPDPAMCLNYWGHRKLIVDPRRVRHLENHVSIDPEGGGVDLPANELRHNHFQGLVWPGAKGECNTTQGGEAHVDWWAHSLDQTQAAEKARTTELDFGKIKDSQEAWRTYVLKARSTAAI